MRQIYGEILSEDDFAEHHHYEVEQRQYEERKFKPTHFIEMYVPNDYKLENHCIDYPLLLSNLDENLKKTKSCGLTTIAIFKIQYKSA